MHEHYRIAQKIGLMFRPDETLPEDMHAWITDQLTMPSVAMGIASVYSSPAPWPAELQPDLAERARLWRRYRLLKRQEQEGKNGQDNQAARQANNRAHLMAEKDELKFVHRNVYAADQINLRLTAFWANHFTIGNTFDTGNMIGHAIDAGILDRLQGSFAEMLYGITTHPGMLTYLDNVWSAGENSAQAKSCRRKPDCHAGLNDNLGRELLELHTVSPAAGYSEDDIRGAAKVLAGWGVNFQQELDKMRRMAGTTDHWNAYKQRWAEPGRKTVMGQSISTGRGGLRQLTDFLASHEHTINHISTKLCRHFVSDMPSARQIESVKSVWRSSNGDLPSIHREVIRLAIVDPAPKFVWPMHWLLQMVRLSGATYFKGWREIHDYNNQLMRSKKIFAELGQSFWSFRQPNGYSDDKADWLSAEMFERRIRFADAVFSNGRPKRSVEKIMARMEVMPETQQLVASVGRSPKDKFIALMCSPELMGLSYA